MWFTIALYALITILFPITSRATRCYTLIRPDTIRSILSTDRKHLFQ